HFLLAYAGVEKLLLGRGRVARGLSARDLGLDFRAVERHHQGAGLDLVSFAHVQLGDAADDLGRDVDVAAVDLALQRRDDRSVGQIKAVDDEGNDTYDDQRA